MRRIDAEVAVIGSGFGGTLTALALNKLGRRVVVVERRRHPRFSIGESSTPVANILLKRLCTRYDLPRVVPLARYGTWIAAYPDLGVGRKRGFSYFGHYPEAPFRPEARREMLVAASRDAHDCDTHWLRADVDAFLAGEVVRAGIPLLHETNLREIEPGRRWRLRGTQDGAPVEISAAFVVDASGAGGVLPRTLGLSAQRAFRTDTRAIYGHFAGVERWGAWLEARVGCTGHHPFPCDEAAVHHLLDEGWLWMLRFRDDRVSAGLVLDRHRHPPARQSARAEWKAVLGRYPGLNDLFAESDLIDPPEGLIRTGRLQRGVHPAAGEGWALLPHTAGFIDPLHSTGIAHTLAGVTRLVRLFERAGGAIPTPEALRSYATAIEAERDWIDALIAVCYAAGSDFDRFRQATLFYFAAVVTFEQALLSHGPGLIDEALFLCADETLLREGVERAIAHLQSNESTASFEALVHRVIAPYDTVGLRHPAVPHMYPHTAPAWD